jgi:hypothetical protein
MTKTGTTAAAREYVQERMMSKQMRHAKVVPSRIGQIQSIVALYLRFS